jgi:hypothetical protein
MTLLLKKLESIYPAVPAKKNAPTESSRKAKFSRMEGQATPKSPSGMPREMNAI